MGKTITTGYILAADRKAAPAKHEYPAVTAAAAAADPYRYGVKAVCSALRGNPSKAIRPYRAAAIGLAGAIRRADIAAAAAWGKEGKAADKAAGKAITAAAAAEKKARSIKAKRGSSAAEKENTAARRAHIRGAAAAKVTAAARRKAEMQAARDSSSRIAAAVAGSIVADMVQTAIVAMLESPTPDSVYISGVRAVYAYIKREQRRAAVVVSDHTTNADGEEIYLLDLQAASDDTERAAMVLQIRGWIDTYTDSKPKMRSAWQHWTGAAGNMAALSHAEQSHLSHLFKAVRAAFSL